MGFQRRKLLIILEKVKGDSRGEMKFALGMGEIIMYPQGFSTQDFPKSIARRHMIKDINDF